MAESTAFVTAQMPTFSSSTTSPIDHCAAEMPVPVCAADDRHQSVPHSSPAREMQQALAGRYDGLADLEHQAHFAATMGSPFVADVLSAARRQLAHAPKAYALIANWPGDPAASAMAMRLNAVLHAIARRGTVPCLSALYAGEHADFDGAVAEALARCDEEIVEALGRHTQTNEVGRAASIVAALMVAQRRFGTSFELLELGSSGGLNLNLDRYGYLLDGQTAGVASSRVQICPEWRGQRLRLAPIRILSARGVDLAPQDPRDPATVDRMMSFIWADQHARKERLACALDLARLHTPAVDRGSAGQWIAQRLLEPQKDGVCRTIFHSMVLQYFDPQERRNVINAIQHAATGATERRPLAWISLEWTTTRSEVRLLLTTWPDGLTRHLASCHPYGAWIDWHGEERFTKNQATMPEAA